jgi:hypothetical protein
VRRNTIIPAQEALSSFTRHYLTSFVRGSRLRVQRGAVLLQEAPDHGKTWLVVPVLVRVRDQRYRLDWESQAAGWFSMTEAMSLPLLPGVEAVIAQYRNVIDPD